MRPYVFLKDFGSFVSIVFNSFSRNVTRLTSDVLLGIDELPPQKQACSVRFSVKLVDWECGSKTIESACVLPV